MAIFKTFMTHHLKILVPVLYIALGWLIVVDFEGLLNVLPRRGVLWLFTGGLCYTVGIIFYAINRIPAITPSGTCS